MRRDIDMGGILFGIVILGIGVYYFAQKTLGLDIPDLNWDRIWPLFVIALGVGIALGALRRRGEGPKGS